MVHDNQVPDSLKRELTDLTRAIDEVVCHFKKTQYPFEDSNEKVPEATHQLENITRQTEEATHRVLDMVEEITGGISDVVQDLKVLRKALPATYFKNRSKVRDTFERIVEKVEKSQDNAFAIMDALQFQDITAQQMGHTAHLLDEVEAKLRLIKSMFSDQNQNEQNSDSQHQSFDPNARYDLSNENQVRVDNLLESVKQGRTD